VRNIFPTKRTEIGNPTVVGCGKPGSGLMRRASTAMVVATMKERRNPRPFAGRGRSQPCMSSSETNLSLEHGKETVDALQTDIRARGWEINTCLGTSKKSE
jgi:hypothetical protein